MVDGTVSTIVLENLTPKTEYLVNVFSVIGEQSSEPLKGTETTCKCLYLLFYYYYYYYYSHL